MFLDNAKITVLGGNGGDGSVSYRREKFIPRGGPDGGDGGRGGDVYLIADPNTDTLSNFSSIKVFKAKHGDAGQGQRKNGRGGEDRILAVPLGTQVEENGTVIGDLKNTGDTLLIAKGGRGGFGNAHFKSSVRRTPDFSENGEPGEKIEVSLELKLVADIGIIGYPSVGKSTLISVISSAKPKIADYPFTTLVPNLGVVDVDSRSYVVCDVPGLIEGASEGKGLGDQFLKHIERCGALVHMLDISRENLVDDYKAIRKELDAFSSTLTKKKELVVLNKSDLKPDEVRNLETELQKAGIEVFMTLSAVTHSGTEELTKKLLPIVLAERERRLKESEEEESTVILKPQEDDLSMRAYNISKQEDGSILITGKRIEQFVTMTDFEAEGGVMRFRHVLDRIGLKKAIARAKASESTKVFIGDISIDEYL